MIDQAALFVVVFLHNTFLYRSLRFLCHLFFPLGSDGFCGQGWLSSRGSNV